MTGYQEILTDPSYRGQIVTMTYPEIGNYGVNEKMWKAGKPHLAGFIVRENSRIASNFRADGDLRNTCSDTALSVWKGSTRGALVRRIRSQGAMKGVLSTDDLDDASWWPRPKPVPDWSVATWFAKSFRPNRGSGMNRSTTGGVAVRCGKTPAERSGISHVVALDFGMKWNIARHLHDLGCRVTILPGTTTTARSAAVRSRRRLSVQRSGRSGTADLRHRDDSQLLGKKPIFGICLGHQLLALACGAQDLQTEVWPPRSQSAGAELDSGKVEITAQNHGFAVEESSLPESLIVTHRNLNDNTIAGLRHTQLPAFCVQYHPEASAGPHDSRYLFEHFHRLMLSA